MSFAAPIVALVSTQRGWHGGEEQARLLAVGIRERGGRCVILARRGGAFAERMSAEGFEVSTFTGGGRSLSAVWHIRRCLRRIKPDVLHYNDAHAMAGAGLAAMGLRIPARIVARRVDFPLRSARLYRWFCDRVVCVSRAVAAVCRQGGIPDEMLRVVHDGVDPARVRSGDRGRGRQALALADDERLLLCVATLTDHKGHRFLLDALPGVIRKYPKVVVALAGVVTAVVVAIRRLDGTFPEPGWTSVMVAVLVLSGGLFISLATVAEFVGFAVRNAIGKPLYVKADAPASRALWQLQRALTTAIRVST